MAKQPKQKIIVFPGFVLFPPIPDPPPIHGYNRPPSTEGFMRPLRCPPPRANARELISHESHQHIYQDLVPNKIQNPPLRCPRTHY